MILEDILTDVSWLLRGNLTLGKYLTDFSYLDFECLHKCGHGAETVIHLTIFQRKWESGNTISLPLHEVALLLYHLDHLCT